MTKWHFDPDQMVQVAQLSEADMLVIGECRRSANKLGFAYQLAFVRLFNRFPAQVPFDPLDDIVTYMSLQLDLPAGLIAQYQQRRQTIAQHRQRIQEYLRPQPFHPDGVRLLAEFLYQEAMQIEPTDSLLIKATTFLRDHHLLNPAEDTLRRMIFDQRNKERTHIFETPAVRQPEAAIGFPAPYRRTNALGVFPDQRCAENTIGSRNEAAVS